MIMGIWNPFDELDELRKDRPKHWCSGCEWGYWLPDRCICPFVVGSCARLPDTLLAPIPHLVTAEDMRAYEKRIRIQQDQEDSKNE